MHGTALPLICALVFGAPALAQQAGPATAPKGDPAPSVAAAPKRSDVTPLTAPRPLRPEDFALVRNVGGPQLSPDGA